MAFTEFCSRSGGSNLNAGARTGSSTEPGTSAAFTYAGGDWDGTSIYTPISGNPSTDGVAVGDFVSIYVTSGATVATFISRVTAVSSSTITVSTTAKSGTAPASSAGGHTMTAKVGGAWAGPNGSVGFPFNFAATAMVNVAGDKLRVNFKNDQTYSITAAMTHTLLGPVCFEGYGSSYGDQSQATVDGGTTGSSYVPLTLSGSGVAFTLLGNMIFGNNGATGSASGLAGFTDPRSFCFRVVVHDMRGSGFSDLCIGRECEAYICNKSNTSNLAGFVLPTGARLKRCVAHDNTGSNNSGMYSQLSGFALDSCILDSNQIGLIANNLGGGASIDGCDFYNNASDGINSATATVSFNISNTNFVKNGGYGLNFASGVGFGYMHNCGFGVGTQANSSGNINNGGAVQQLGAVNYATGVTPWVDPANGDFRVNLATAKGAGRGAFTQTQASYTGAVGYPDIGSAQHLESGGSAGARLVNASALVTPAGAV